MKDTLSRLLLHGFVTDPSGNGQDPKTTGLPHFTESLKVWWNGLLVSPPKEDPPSWRIRSPADLDGTSREEDPICEIVWPQGPNYDFGETSTPLGLLILSGTPLCLREVYKKGSRLCETAGLKAPKSSSYFPGDLDWWESLQRRVTLARPPLIFLSMLFYRK